MIPPFVSGFAESVFQMQYRQGLRTRAVASRAEA
jgi:hypothetical protein